MSGARHIAAAAVAAMFAAGFAAGCLSPHQSAAVDVDPASWSSPATVTLPNTDTATLRDLRLFLRCNDRFAEDTFTLRIAVATPDSLRFEEPFLVSVVRQQRPAALMREAVVVYRRRTCFGRSGDYRMTFTPVRPLKGVEAIGVNIVRSE